MPGGEHVGTVSRDEDAFQAKNGIHLFGSPCRGYSATSMTADQTKESGSYSASNKEPLKMMSDWKWVLGMSVSHRYVLFLARQLRGVGGDHLDSTKAIRKA